MKDLTSIHELKSKIYQFIQSLPLVGLDKHHTEALWLLTDALVEIDELVSYIEQAESHMVDINDKIVKANQMLKELLKERSNRTT